MKSNMKKHSIFLLLLLSLLLSHVASAQNVTVTFPQKQQPALPKPVITVKLAAEKDGERVYYTTKEWERMSHLEKCGYNKIGLVIGSGNSAFLLSLNYNNMSRGTYPQKVSYKEAFDATGGQLPTKNQLQIIRNNRQTIGSASQIFGGDQIYASYLWGENGTYAYMGSGKESFYDKAMFRICTNDIEKGFDEVTVHKADSEEYDYVGSGPYGKYDDCLQIVGLRKKYGFVDTTGKVVIPIKYDDVDGGSPREIYSNNWSGDGLMSVCINGKWGYIDRKGEVVVPIIYDRVDKRSYSPEYIVPGITRVWKEGLVGGINYKGEWLLPLEYQEIEDNYSKDLFFVKKEGKYGFFNSDFQPVIPCKYDFTSGFSKKGDLCAVGINGKYGYIDKKGNEVIPMSYDFAEPFYNGLAAVVKDDKMGYINQSGELVIPLKFEVEYMSFRYDSFTEDYRKSLGFACGFEYSPYVAFVKSTNDKWGIIDRKGELQTDYIYDRVTSAGTAGFTCSIGGKSVYLDVAGNEYQTEEERTEKSIGKMAEQGYADAQYELGRQYLRSKNYEMAHEWLLKAADQGRVDAVKAIADAYKEREEYKLAYDWYLKAVEGGDIESLRHIGNLFFYEKGLEVSYSKATEWYLKYLEYSDCLEYNNNSYCFYNLGYIHYYGGNGIQASYEKALDYFEKSTNLDAKYFLGWMYEHGQGVRRDYAKAIECYKASKGRRDAVKRIKTLEMSLN